MLRLAQMRMLGRQVRQDEWPDLGCATQEKLIEAIEAGRMDEAKSLARYMIAEGKPLHDLFCDWIWDIFTQVGLSQGDDAVYHLTRATQQTWMMRRTWKAFMKMSVEERVYLSAEIMRSHRCGPHQDGALEIIEETDRITIAMDPCGSGGRMRRGDPVDGTASRLAPPYNFGVTRDAHSWCWSKKGVPYYCVHCAVNEILSIEWGGHPLWVTGYSDDHQAPCYWHFYKAPELIPEEYFTRLGCRKPAKF